MLNKKQVITSFSKKTLTIEKVLYFGNKLLFIFNNVTSYLFYKKYLLNQKYKQKFR